MSLTKEKPVAQSLTELRKKLESRLAIAEKRDDYVRFLETSDRLLRCLVNLHGVQYDMRKLDILMGKRGDGEGEVFNKAKIDLEEFGKFFEKKKKELQATVDAAKKAEGVK